MQKNIYDAKPKDYLFDPCATDMHNKIILITGASNGLGRAVAINCAEKGGHVIALGRDLAALESLDDIIQNSAGSATLIPSDLCNPNLWNNLYTTLNDRFGKLDAVFANAAILGELTPLTDINHKIWSQTFDINLGANLRLLQTCTPLLKKSEKPHMLFVSSSVAQTFPSYWGAYSISKAALEALAFTAAKEFAPDNKTNGIRINILDPGRMATKMRAKAMPGEDQSTITQTDEVAPLCSFLLSSQCDITAKRFNFNEWK